MHQIASTILSFFLSPFNWIASLLIISFIIKAPHLKKIFRISAAAIFLIFSNSWLLNAYAKMWQPQPHNIAADAPYSAAIVLGGFGSTDENVNGYFNTSADRFIQAVKLYKIGKVQHIIISGGNGKMDQKEFREAVWAKSEMETLTVPDSVILCEDRSDNTADNAAYTKQMLDSAHFAPPYLLITSAQHIPRASLIFKNAGLTTVAFPCNYIAGKDGNSFKDILPDPDKLLIWNKYLKETAAYFIYYIKGK